MTAPTKIGATNTGGAATASVSGGSSQVGDLLVYYVWGAPAGGFTSTIVDDISAGTGDAGFTYHGESAGSGTNRIRIWSKIVTAADLGGGTLHAFGLHGWTTNASRMGISVFRHPQGWNASRLVSFQHHEANIANAATMFTMTNPSPDEPALAVALKVGATATIAWDGAGGVTADLFANSISSDGASNLYDQGATPATVAWSAGQNNTTHAAVLALFTVAVAPMTTATETDTAFALGKAKRRAVGTALEADLAPAITIPSHNGGPIATAQETDTLGLVGRVKRRALTTATETDATFVVRQSKGHTLGTAGETDTTGTVGHYKTATFTVALADPPLFPIASATLHAVAKKDTVGDAGDIRVTLNQGATPLGSSAWVPLTDTYADTTVTVAQPGAGATLTATIEVRTATQVNPLVDQVYVDLFAGLGAATETDLALALGRTIGRIVQPAVEVDVALAVGHQRSVTLGLAEEFDQASTVAGQLSRPGRHLTMRGARTDTALTSQP